LIAGLADHRLLVREAAEDRLHQDYRSPLFPEAQRVLAGMLAGGALAACWSGSGPSLLGIALDHDAAAVRRSAIEAMGQADVPGRVLVLHPDLRGLVTGDTEMLPIGELDDAGSTVLPSGAEPSDAADAPVGLFDFEDQ
jgi:homoserine kinase